MEINSVSAFLEYYKRITERTDKVVRLVPPDRLEWTYQPGKYSCGDLVRHIAAMERLMYLESVVRNRSLYNGCGTEKAAGHAAVMDFYQRLRAGSWSILTALSDPDLAKKCKTPGGIRISVWKWLRAMIEHEVHHRAQIYLYLGMFGVEAPPIFGMTAEAVQAKAAPTGQVD